MSGAGLWDGFLSNLISAIISSAVATGVALYVLWRTRVADTERFARQIEAERESQREQLAESRRALALQIEANRHMAEERAERDRRMARERMSLEAAEVLNSATHGCIAELRRSEQEHASPDARHAAKDHFSETVLAKAPALDDRELYHLVRVHAVDAVERYCAWTAERVEIFAGYRRHARSLAQQIGEDGVHDEVLRVTIDYLLYVNECITAYRQNTPIGTREPPPVFPPVTRKPPQLTPLAYRLRPHDLG